MAIILIKHLLADYDKWKEALTDLESMHTVLGIKSYHTVMDKTNSSILITEIQMPDLRMAKLFVQADQFLERLRKVGLSGRFEIEIKDVLNQSSIL